jgi:predicted metal-dependent HD superfamily phosphohydrolase
MIEGTALHRAHDRDGALLNDIDLAVLGSSPHQFARYDAAIREEYRHVDQRLFRVGRERALRSFLEATSIYSTPFFSQRFEAQARTNLSRALRAFRGTDHMEED